MHSLTITIDARQLTTVSAGGVGFVTEGLLRGLARLEDGSERYRVVAYPEQRERLQKLAKNRMDLVFVARPSLQQLRWRFRNVVDRFPRAQQLRDKLPRRAKTMQSAGPLLQDPLIDALDCDLVHFPSQHFATTMAPAIYNPHDLQHLHYPQFFTHHQYDLRERIYRAGCARASRIVVSSSWVKRDLTTQYGIDPHKIQVIPWGIEQTRSKVTPLDQAAARRHVGLKAQDNFALYPASTWEHKNHLRLLEAFAVLRPQFPLKLVCCGHRNAFFPNIARKVRNLGLGNRVQFPGVLSRRLLDALYSQASLIVIPSLFEASSALLREAWRWQRPVACAAVTSLPEQAGSSALLFDPMRPDDIADAIRRVVTDRELRDALIAAGDRRLGRFTWRRTATAYRALYRSATGIRLTDEDRELLAYDWMREK